MDPTLSKLWELDVADELSLSHLLPSTKYAWGSEAVSPPPDSFLCYTNGPLSESHGSDRRFCRLCESPNRDDANWCIECGSAIVGTNTLSANLLLQCDRRSDTSVSPSHSPEIFPRLLDNIMDQSLTASPKSDSFHSPETCTPLQAKTSMENGLHLAVNYLNLCDPMTHGEPLTVKEQPNNYSMIKPIARSLTPASQPSNVSRNDSDAVRMKNTSPLVPQNNYRRHWNTSGVHMWRKPRSIQQSNQQCQTLDLLGDLPGCHADHVKQPPTIHRKPDNNSLVPLIDLSAIERDLGSTSECISLRTSSSIYDVRINPCENFSCGMFACLQQIPLPDVVNLLFLPDEIFLMVLSNLSHRDLANCMLVCKRLFHIASDPALCEFLIFICHNMYTEPAYYCSSLCREKHSSSEIQ